MEKAYRNISYFSILIFFTLVWGFFKSYFGKIPTFDGVTVAQHAHGILMLAWMALLIAQPLLIRNRKLEWHRRLGKISYVLVPLLLISIFFVAKGQYLRMAVDMPKNSNIAGLALSLPDIPAFAILYILAIVHKKNVAYHMRYMIATLFLLIGPGVGRGIIIYCGVPFPIAIEIISFLAESVAIAFIIYDIKNKGTYQPYVVALCVLIGMHLVWESQNSFWWQAFGEKFVACCF